MAQEGTFVWSSGSLVNFTNWRTDEPSNATDPINTPNGEDYVHMTSDGGWNDIYDVYYFDSTGNSTYTFLQRAVVEVAVDEPNALHLFLMVLAALFIARRYALGNRLQTRPVLMA